MNLKYEDFKEVHEFHYRECGLLIDWLDRLRWHFELSRSGMIVKILDTTIPLLEKYHFKREEQDCRYRKVERYRYPKKNYLKREEEIKKVVSVHCYMPEALYRKLKQVKGDLNFHSIAQLVRELMRFFLWLFDRYGVECLNLLEAFAESARRQKSWYRKTGKALRQLSGIKSSKPEMSITYTRAKHINRIQLQ